MIMTDSKFEKLVGQINSFGFTNPFVINIDNMIVCGHSRRKALIQLGRVDEEVPVRVPNRALSSEEFELIALGDNRYISAFDPKLVSANFNPDVLLKLGFERWEFGNLNNDLLATMPTFADRPDSKLPEDDRSTLTPIDLEALKSEGSQLPEHNEQEPSAEQTQTEKEMAFELLLKLSVRRSAYQLITELREKYNATTVSQAFLMIIETMERAKDHPDFKDIFGK